MSTKKISPSDTLEFFVDEQASQRGYGNSSECARELILEDQDRRQLSGLLIAGAASTPAAPADAAYFDALRRRARGRAKTSTRG